VGSKSGDSSLFPFNTFPFAFFFLRQYSLGMSEITCAWDPIGNGNLIYRHTTCVSDLS